MAARRIAKSSIDWVALLERVPENQRQQFQAFKAKSDTYLGKVYAYPENPPPLDWSHYRANVPLVDLVSKFETQYKAVKVPFPADKVTSEIDAQEAEAKKEIEAFCQQSKQRIATYQSEIDKWMKLIPFEHMTMEDYREAFPENAYDPIGRPTFWPHEPDGQVGYKSEEAHSSH